MHLEGMEGQKAVADSVGVSKAILQTWIRQYQHHGEGSFKKSYTTYSADSGLYNPVPPVEGSVEALQAEVEPSGALRYILVVGKTVG
jgi:transposase-like protein